MTLRIYQVLMAILTILLILDLVWLWQAANQPVIVYPPMHYIPTQVPQNNATPAIQQI
jgi:hypothetical protein